MNVTPLPALPNSSSSGSINNDSVSMINITVVSLLLNLIVLIATAARKSLQTPFNVYIMALLFSNVVYVTVVNPLRILSLHNGWRDLGNAACTVYLYGTYVLAAIPTHIHVLISVNRIWALFWPISYKRRHNSTVAWGLCLIILIYLHIVLVPALILDDFYYRLPLSHGCWLNSEKQFGWTLFKNIFVYDAPIVLIPIVYPLLLWKQVKWTSQRRQLKPQRSGTVAENGNNIQQMGTASAGQSSRNKKSGSRPFIVLTLLTISVAICRIPSSVYYTMTEYFPQHDSGNLKYIQGAMYTFLCILDPLFFCLSVQDLYTFFDKLCKTMKRG